MSFKILFLFVIFNFSICAASNAQDNSKNVTITVSGSGNTAEEAKQAALRSAIEQAYGSFISTKTEVFNDRVVADEMASVSSGNIQSYKMLNESQLPNGTWGVTLNALVSIDKLTSFAESKGMAVEIKGGIFALNIKQQLINEASEQKIVSELVEILHEALQVSFDYVLKAGEPKSKDGGSQNWEIPVTVSAIGNSNLDFSVDYLTKTLNAISLSENEVERYHTIEKPVYLVRIWQWQNHNYYKKSHYFYLRNRNTLSILLTLAGQWNFYKTNFILKNGKETLTYNAPDHDHGGLRKIVRREEKKSYDFNIYAGTYEFVDSYGFSSNGDVAGEFIFKDNKTLTEISEMTGYSIKAGGVSNKLPSKHGGFVVKKARTIIPTTQQWKVFRSVMSSGTEADFETILNIYESAPFSEDKLSFSVEKLKMVSTFGKYLSTVKNDEKVKKGIAALMTDRNKIPSDFRQLFMFNNEFRATLQSVRNAKRKEGNNAVAEYIDNEIKSIR